MLSFVHLNLGFLSFPLDYINHDEAVSFVSVSLQARNIKFKT
jgi:hypothetical protein